MFTVSAGVDYPVTLADGRVVVAGDQVDEVDPKDQYLVGDGVLIEAKEQKKATPKKAAADKKEDDK